MGFFQKTVYFIGLGVVLCMGEEKPVDHGTFFAQTVDSFVVQCMDRFGIALGDSLWIHGISDENPRMSYFFTSMIQSFRNREVFVFSKDSLSSERPRLWMTVLHAGIRYEKLPSRFFGKKQFLRVAEIQVGCRFFREAQRPLEGELISVQTSDTISTRDLDRLGKDHFLLENGAPPSIISFRHVMETILAFATIGYTLYLFYSIRSD